MKGTYIVILKQPALRGEICGHKARLTPPFFIEVPVPSQENERSYICVLWVSSWPLSMTLILDFGFVPTGYFFYFIFFRTCNINCKNYRKQIFASNIYMDLKTILAVIGGLDIQLPVQSVFITTKVVISNSVHGKVYSIQHYLIKFVSVLRQVGGFLRILRSSPPIQLTATI